MEILRQLLGGLGASGAARNAELALLARDAEDRAVDALAERLAAAEAALAAA